METRSGISETIPAMLPHFGPLTDTALIANMLCYAVRYYQNVGISCLITRNDGNVKIVTGDWNGRAIDLADKKDSLSLIAVDFLRKQAADLIKISSAAGVNQAIYYFALDTGTPVLVDIRTSLNKFLGPGMVRDVFGNCFDTQQVLKIDIMSETLLKQITDCVGCFSHGTIIKPSRARSIEENGKLLPLYVGVQCSS
jgi:hypothetical protein